MKSLHNAGLISNLSDKTIFLDTNVLIGAIEFPRLITEFLKLVMRNGAVFMTIPSVAFEFSRGSSKSIKDFNTRANFLKSMCTIYPIEKLTLKSDLQAFIHVVQSTCNRIDYTEFLLVYCLYNFKSAFLISENYQHMPTSILDRVDIVTFDTDKDIRTYGLYKFSEEKFAIQAERLLRNQSTSSTI